MALAASANWQPDPTPQDVQPAIGGVHRGEWAAELAGTALLFGVGFSVVALLVSPYSPIADAVRPIRFLLVGLNFGILSALIAVSPLGRRSGAHLNPAVTLAFWLRGDVHLHDLVGYLGAQFAGAAIGTAVFDTALGPWASSIHLARTVPTAGLAGSVAIEATLTCSLLVTVFACLSSPRLARWTPAAVAVVLTGLIWAGSPPTGASLNPARSLAPAVLDGNLSGLWVYFVGPALGAIGAVAAGRIAGRAPRTAKLFHDPRYATTMRCVLPVPGAPD